MNQHHWQDARLKKALEHAPDRTVEPSAQTREHILLASSKALEEHASHVKSKSDATWWHALWQNFTSPQRAPFSAAWGVAIVAVGAAIFWSFDSLNTSSAPYSEEIMVRSTPPSAASPALNQEDQYLASLDQSTQNNSRSRVLEREIAITAPEMPSPSLSSANLNAPMTREKSAEAVEHQKQQTVPTERLTSSDTNPSFDMHADLSTALSTPAPTLMNASQNFIASQIEGWESVVVSSFNANDTFTKENSSWLPKLFEQITSTPENTSSLPITQKASYMLTFYAPNDLFLGSLMLSEEYWYFLGTNQATIRGTLSAEQYHLTQATLDAKHEEP